jgi:hypothetical protein
VQLGEEGIAAFVATPKPSRLRAVPPTRQIRSAGLKRPRKAATTRVDAADAANTAHTTRLPATRGYQPGSRDDQEAHRHKELLSASNGLGGSNLYSFRNSVGSKRTRESGDTDQAEASFAKPKRIHALKAEAEVGQP